MEDDSKSGQTPDETIGSSEKDGLSSFESEKSDSQASEREAKRIERVSRLSLSRNLLKREMEMKQDSNDIKASSDDINDSISTNNDNSREDDDMSEEFVQDTQNDQKLLKCEQQNEIESNELISNEDDSMVDEYYNIESSVALGAGASSILADIELRRKQYEWISFFGDSNGLIEIHVSKDAKDTKTPIIDLATNEKKVDPLDIGYFDMRKHENLFGCEYDPDVLETVSIFKGEPLKSEVLQRLSLNEYLEYYSTRHPISNDSSESRCLEMRSFEKNITGFIRFDHLSDEVIHELRNISNQKINTEANTSPIAEAAAVVIEEKEIVELQNKMPIHSNSSNSSNYDAITSRSSISNSHNNVAKDQIFVREKRPRDDEIAIYSSINESNSQGAQNYMYKRVVESNSYHLIQENCSIFDGETVSICYFDDLMTLDRIVVMFGENDKLSCESFVLFIGSVRSLKPYMVESVKLEPSVYINLRELHDISSLKVKDDKSYSLVALSNGKWILDNVIHDIVLKKHVKELNFHLKLKDYVTYTELGLREISTKFKKAKDYCKNNGNGVSKITKAKLFEKTLDFIEMHLKSFERLGEEENHHQESQQHQVSIGKYVNVEMSREIVKRFLNVTSTTANG